MAIIHNRSGHQGEHWAALYFGRSFTAFFCSNGSSPSAYGWEQQIQKLSASRHILWSPRTIQPSNSQHCGLYCIYVLFCLARGQSFQSIVKRFSAYDQDLNDQIVSGCLFRYFRFSFRTRTHTAQQQLADLLAFTGTAGVQSYI